MLKREKERQSGASVATIERSSITIFQGRGVMVVAIQRNSLRQNIIMNSSKQLVRENEIVMIH